MIFSLQNRIYAKATDGSFVVRGELSFTTVPPLLANSGALFEADEAMITLDLQEVERADSAGLSLLIQWWRQARAIDKQIQYINLPGQMRAMAELSGLTDLLPIKS